MDNHIAKHSVLQLASLISLYLSLTFFISLIFGTVNLLYPDAASSSWEIEGSKDMVRLGFAMVVVFFPTYLVLTRLVNKLRRTETGGAYLTITKWLIYLSLLVGIGTLLINLAVLILTFLNGELTTRFLLKSGAVFMVVGAALDYYILDARGFWLTREKLSLYYGIGVLALVVVMLAFSLRFIDTPSEVRERRIDEKQISDLQNIQYAIQDHILTTGTVPASLDELGMVLTPTAPDGRSEYIYRVTDTGFELCASFTTESLPDQFFVSVPLQEKGQIRNPDNWQHGTGEVCFNRIVNAEATN